MVCSHRCALAGTSPSAGDQTRSRTGASTKIDPPNRDGKGAYRAIDNGTGGIIVAP
jgi:hypothetical protein